MNEDKIRQLEMTQSAIERMATNSFYLKGWAVTLVAGLFAISIADNGPRLYLIAYIPVVFFAVLDAYYLWVERRYRALFDQQISSTEPPTFSMDTSKFSRERNGFLGSFFSISILLFYGPLGAVIGIVGCSISTIAKP